MGKSSLPKVHRYSMQFKATAVRLSELPDVLIQDVAEALDIHPNTDQYPNQRMFVVRIRGYV